MSHIGSYTEIYHVAHKAVEDIFSGPVLIEEKVDGSFCSFMLDENDGLLMRSKGQALHEGSPSSKMFNEAMASIKERADLLVPNQVWRAEYLRAPKHNTIKYDRVPKGHLVVFDIELSMGNYASSKQRQEMAEFIGLESVPILFEGLWDKDLAALKEFFELDSYLGGSKIEGVVVKNHQLFLGGYSFAAGKLVSEAFKESHNQEWKKSNPSKGDIVDQLIKNHKTEARWLKAVQHLRDAGKLTNSPVDIGPLLKEISEDVKKEEEDAIKEALFKWAYPKISRGMTAGFVDWYKERLLQGEE